jgi:hypothetical protein
MKKLFFILTFISLFDAFSFTSDIQKKFIKGNLQDKTSAVKEASGSDAQVLTKKGLAFILENSEVLGQDRDLSALAVACLFKLPKDKSSLETSFPEINKDLISIFNLFEDETVRIGVLDKFETTCDLNGSENFTGLLNKYLSEAGEKNRNSAVTGKVITCLKTAGNTESFSIMYKNWKNNTFPEFKNETEKALIALSSKHITETIKIISSSKIREIRDFFELINKSDEISKDFKAEIAENALSVTIHNTEDISADMTDSISLQLQTLQTISDANWTRAAGLAVRFFSLAKEEYEKSILQEAQFIQVIGCITKLSSPDTAQSLSAYLAEMNSKTEKNNIPAQNVVLAVIKSLGALGDKSAFDNLLYVTYLNYPEAVKNAARDSLAKLKW